MTPAPTYLTAPQVAEWLQLDRTTVYRLADSDPTFPATRIGRSLRFERGALERWLTARTQGSRR
jgi:excisionase family DNA binding protein